MVVVVGRCNYADEITGNDTTRCYVDLWCECVVVVIIIVIIIIVIIIIIIIIIIITRGSFR